MSNFILEKLPHTFPQPTEGQQGIMLFEQDLTPAQLEEISELPLEHALGMLARRSAIEDAHSIFALARNSTETANERRQMSVFWNSVASELFGDDTNLQASYHANREAILKQIVRP